jgi:hypothetical protein
VLLAVVIVVAVVVVVPRRGAHSRLAALGVTLRCPN